MSQRKLKSKSARKLQNSKIQLAFFQTENFLDDKKFVIKKMKRDKFLTLSWESKNVLLCTLDKKLNEVDAIELVRNVLSINQLKSLEVTNENYLESFELYSQFSSKPIFNFLSTSTHEERELIKKFNDVHIHEMLTGKLIPADDVKDLILALIRLQLIDDSKEILERCRELIFKPLIQEKKFHKKVEGKITIEWYGVRYEVSGRALTALINFLNEEKATRPSNAISNAQIKKYFIGKGIKPSVLDKILQSGDITVLTTRRGKTVTESKSSITNEIFNHPFNGKGVFLNPALRIIEE